MLSRKIPKLRLDLKCKGRSKSDSNTTSYNSFSLRSSKYRQFGKYALQGVPVLSIFALVGMLICSSCGIILLDSPKTYAKCAPDSNIVTDPTTGECIDLRDPVCPSGYIWNATDKQCDVGSLEPTTPSTNATPSVSMVIDNNTIHDTVYTGRGTTAYASHIINVNASKIEDYKLTLSPTKTLTGPSTIGNATGQKGNSLNANTWGYGWGATNTTEDNLTYNSLASSVDLSGDKVVDNKVSFSKKLAFAAKFGEDANEGTYSASVNLSLTVTPQKIVAWNDMVYMQDMSAAACESVPVGTSKTLTDIRDTNTYTIQKLNNEQCWMTQNLRIMNKEISSDNSDIKPTANGEMVKFQVPASSTSGFSDNTASNAYYPNDTTKGAYYTWCAATAGTCSSATSGGVNAPSSICPKGWHLPVSGTGTTGTNTGATSDTKNDFMSMLGKTSTSSYADASLVSGTNINLNGVSWPFAGYYDSSSPYNVGSRGYYWSRTAYDSTDAYRLYVDIDGNVNPANGDRRSVGFSVRCVAYSN